MNSADILDQIANGVFEANEAERNAAREGASALRTDHMDIAYLAMGALRALDKDGRVAYRNFNEDGIILAMLTKCGPALQKVWCEVKADWEGMWLYDIAEPIGMWFINEWVRRDEEPSVEDCVAQARKWANE